MSDPDRVKIPSSALVRTDKEALQELLVLCKHVLETTGLIRSLLELPLNKGDIDPAQHVLAVQVLAVDARLAMERFASGCRNLCITGITSGDSSAHLGKSESESLGAAVVDCDFQKQFRQGG
jgi:hypothetical protein